MWLFWGFFQSNHWGSHIPWTWSDVHNVEFHESNQCSFKCSWHSHFMKQEQQQHSTTGTDAGSLCCHSTYREHRNRCWFTVLSQYLQRTQEQMLVHCAVTVLTENTGYTRCDFPQAAAADGINTEQHAMLPFPYTTWLFTRVVQSFKLCFLSAHRPTTQCSTPATAYLFTTAAISN